jgi:hypothetical protein
MGCMRRGTVVRGAGRTDKWVANKVRTRKGKMCVDRVTIRGKFILEQRETSWRSGPMGEQKIAATREGETS